MPPQVGTPMYCAPEIFDGNRYNTGVDVYSFAVTVFECACRPGYAKGRYRSVSRMAACGGWRPEPTKALVKNHPLVWTLIQECWRSEDIEVNGAFAASPLATDVAKRPTFMSIVERLTAMRPSTALEDKPQQQALHTDELEVARARHCDSPKDFACFLSHHEQGCVTEVEQVKQELASLLDANVFLGKRTHLQSLLKTL